MDEPATRQHQRDHWGPGFQSVVVDGSNDYVEMNPISVSRVFADVAPGVHTFSVRTYTTSTSDFALLHADGTAIVQDTGFTCG